LVAITDDDDAPAVTPERFRRRTAILQFLGLVTFAAALPLPGKYEEEGDFPEQRDLPHESEAPPPEPSGGAGRRREGRGGGGPLVGDDLPQPVGPAL
jgi:hypothetical protein